MISLCVGMRVKTKTNDLYNGLSGCIVESASTGADEWAVALDASSKIPDAAGSFYFRTGELIPVITENYGEEDD